MSNFFIFEVHRSQAEERNLCVFCNNHNYETDELGLAVLEELRDVSGATRLTIIGFATAIPFFDQQLSSGRFLDRVREYLLCDPEAIRWLAFRADGSMLIRGDGWTAYDDPAFICDIRQQGLLSLFRRREGILESDTSFHFAKPSEAHSDKFIRTADVLVDSAEIDFLAAWLLSYASFPVSHIYCDTAAISVVAYALSRVRAWLTGEHFSRQSRVFAPMRDLIADS